MRQHTPEPSRNGPHDADTFKQVADAVGLKHLSVAYRIRCLLLDRWNLWKRPVMYRQWQGAGGERPDGTNNRCERAIGNRIKKRYRTMRGYKRKESAVRVSRLLVWAGNHTLRGGAPLVLLLK